MAAESVSVNRINKKKPSESASYAKLDSNICQKARQPKRLTRFFQRKQVHRQKRHRNLFLIRSRMVAGSVSHSRRNTEKTSEAASYAKIDNNIWQKVRQPAGS